jgi:hypothetical protein
MEEPAPEDAPWPERRTAAPRRPGRPVREEPAEDEGNRTLPVLRVLVLVCVTLLAAVVVLLVILLGRERAGTDAVIQEQETVAPIESEEPYQETRDAILVGEEG